MFNGLTQGLKMIAGALLMYARATAALDTVAAADIMTVFGQWMLDLTGVTLGWNGSADSVPTRLSTWSMLFGDPFKPSREAYKAVRAKWGKYA